jgi:hypothetical protein
MNWSSTKRGGRVDRWFLLLFLLVDNYFLLKIVVCCLFWSFFLVFFLEILSSYFLHRGVCNCVFLALLTTGHCFYLSRWMSRLFYLSLHHLLVTLRIIGAETKLFYNLIWKGRILVAYRFHCFPDGSSSWLKSLNICWLNSIGSFSISMFMRMSEPSRMQQKKRMRWWMFCNVLSALPSLSYVAFLILIWWLQSHAGKVVERHWYEKNKHIFPASRWEVRQFTL